jgi:hypothetical protein
LTAASEQVFFSGGSYWFRTMEFKVVISISTAAQIQRV